MKRLVVLSILLSLLAFSFTSCATKGFVREEVSRVENRLNNVDARVKALESKVADAASKRDVEAIKRDVQRVRDLSEQCCGEAMGVAKEALLKAERAIEAFENRLRK